MWRNSKSTFVALTQKSYKITFTEKVKKHFTRLKTDEQAFIGMVTAS